MYVEGMQQGHVEGVVYVFWALSSEKKRQNVVVSDEIYSSLVVFFYLYEI